MLRNWLALLLVCWFAAAGADELQPVPVLAAHVTDLTQTLAAGERRDLEAKLTAFERDKGAQIAVLLVATTRPETIEQYAIRVAEQWKLGRTGVDDGVLLLIARDDRRLRIEVGYGLEGALNDATAKRIVAETITPLFREKRFAEGIDAGVARIMAVVSGEPLPPPKPRAGRAKGGEASPGIEQLLILGLVLSTVVAGILRAIFGRFLGATIVGGIAGFIVMTIASSLLIAVGAGLIVFLFALLSGGRGGGFGGWGGGYSGGSWGGGSGGGFGGFSGGGGGFGGGGASGDW